MAAKPKPKRPGLQVNMRPGDTVTADGPVTVLKERNGKLRFIAARQVRIVHDRKVRLD